MRRSWAATPAENRLPDWLAAYKHAPELLVARMILTEAGRLGVRAVVALDGDWRRMAEFDVFTIL